MNGPTSLASSNRNAPSATWTALLECVESAESGVLDLDGGAPQVVALAEHLVDLGLLRVPRAGCYALTSSGRDMIAHGKTAPPRTPTKKLSRSIVLLLVAGFGAIVLALWASL